MTTAGGRGGTGGGAGAGSARRAVDSHRSQRRHASGANGQGATAGGGGGVVGRRVAAGKDAPSLTRWGRAVNAGLRLEPPTSCSDNRQLPTPPAPPPPPSRTDAQTPTSKENRRRRGEGREQPARVSPEPPWSRPWSRPPPATVLPCLGRKTRRRTRACRARPRCDQRRADSSPPQLPRQCLSGGGGLAGHCRGDGRPEQSLIGALRCWGGGGAAKSSRDDPPVVVASK